ncbi:MAG: GNAT family N-acetyltransferase [Pirellulaceae bacterium]
MPGELHFRLLGSLDELRRESVAWDDLWRRTQSAMPTAQAELIAQWVEHFAPQQRFAAAVVEDEQGRMAAALPLIGVTVGRVLEVGQLPSNCWSPGGDLLVDSRADADAALEVLAAGLPQLPWPLLWLDEVEWNGPLWYAFRQAAWHADRDYSTHHQFDVGVIDIDHDWPAYEARWSGNHRRSVRVGLRRLEEEGDVQFEAVHYPRREDLESLLREGFEVEDRSWKGAEGSSVLKSPGMFEFFLRQAQSLAERGQLELYLLRLDGRPIAFEYCYVAGGVCYSHKLGYDQQYARCAPGLVLRKMQLEQLFADDDRGTFNTLGILCETKAKWSTRAYSVGRLVVSTGHELSPLLMHAYRGWRYLSPRLGRHKDYERPKLGAAPSPEKASPPAEPAADHAFQTA